MYKLTKKGEARVILDEKAFDELVSGKIVEREGIKIILQDIGYLRMIEILEEGLDKLIKKQYERSNNN